MQGSSRLNKVCGSPGLLTELGLFTNDADESSFLCAHGARIGVPIGVSRGIWRALTPDLVVTGHQVASIAIHTAPNVGQSDVGTAVFSVSHAMWEGAKDTDWSGMQEIKDGLGRSMLEIPGTGIGTYLMPEEA